VPRSGGPLHTNRTLAFRAGEPEASAGLRAATLGQIGRFNTLRSEMSKTLCRIFAVPLRAILADLGCEG
jgi:hypothetical protein